MLSWLLAGSMVLSCTDVSHTTIVAHRGGMDSDYPENTLPAFHRAALAGAHAIELDLRATRDGQIVVLHDPRVDRTTNGRGLVHHLTAAELRHLEAAQGIGIPSLAEVLAETDRLDVELVLDLKPAPGLDLERVVAEAAAQRRLAQVIFGIRSLDDLALLTRIRPGLRMLAFVPRPEHIDGFLEAGVEIVRLWPRWLTRQPELADRVHAAGARVWVTAGDASIDELKELASLGADGLLTDRPSAAVTGFRCR